MGNLNFDDVEYPERKTMCKHYTACLDRAANKNHKDVWSLDCSDCPAYEEVDGVFKGEDERAAYLIYRIFNRGGQYERHL